MVLFVKKNVNAVKEEGVISADSVETLAVDVGTKVKMWTMADSVDKMIASCGILENELLIAAKKE